MRARANDVGLAHRLLNAHVGADLAKVTTAELPGEEGSLGVVATHDADASELPDA